MPPSQRYSGFTLTETLLSLGVAAILLLLLFTGVDGIRQKAMTTKAIHNARILAAAGVKHATEHKGAIPRTYWAPNRADAHLDTNFIKALIPYVYENVRLSSTGALMVDGVFRAPGLSGYRRSQDQWTIWNWNQVDWINISHSRRNGPATTAVVINTYLDETSRTPFLISSDRNDGTGGLGEGFQTQFSKYVPEEIWIYGGGAIVAYCDGHVEIVRAPTSTNIFKR